MGIFSDEETTLSAVRALKETPWSIENVMSPIPSREIADELSTKPSRVGYFTLAGGIIGFFTGFALSAYTALQWQLVVSGKPIVALVPFFIVGFEFTILFAVFGNVVGLILKMKLPDYRGLADHDSRCTGACFCVVAVCPVSDEQKLLNFLKNSGADTRILS
ncbi:MAG: hypothetical protein COX20_13655 [Desulfobacterales bacterium CG23_combo_of_CG06-09_8_20_14_all_52_9]|nr:MAG: hypothetical protein COX20_13655 [Desulfobacterales bacterium CG23_combo_of_CG06-09_8_20_14_all_52_9]